ncbi:MAG TPA: hypothetical protein VEF89_24025 [Solirubrobacteraceae bacterium]|nr:hypothetical protein [Solirubrobacteraceae bacterium]
MQGNHKAQTREEFGDEQFMLWRRSYDVPPPPIADDDPLSPVNDPPNRRKLVLVAAHGNSLRALVKHLDAISDEAIAALNLPTRIPLVYELDTHFSPITPGGRYLDPDAA